MRVFSAPERSEEGREQLLLAVGDEAVLANSIAIKKSPQSSPIHDTSMMLKRRGLIGEGKALYWLSGSIHSPETGSPEMLMELAYRLAVEESPFIQEDSQKRDRADHAGARG